MFILFTHTHARASIYIYTHKNFFIFVYRANAILFVSNFNAVEFDKNST